MGGHPVPVVLAEPLDADPAGGCLQLVELDQADAPAPASEELGPELSGVEPGTGPGPIGPTQLREPLPQLGTEGTGSRLGALTALAPGHLSIVPGRGDRSGTTQAASPPSTTRTCPVMKDAAGLQRNATAAAISSAVPWRRSGVNRTSSASCSGLMELAVSSVCT